MCENQSQVHHGGYVKDRNTRMVTTLETRSIFENPGVFDRSRKFEKALTGSLCDEKLVKPSLWDPPGYVAKRHRRTWRNRNPWPRDEQMVSCGDIGTESGIPRGFGWCPEQFYPGVYFRGTRSRGHGRRGHRKVPMKYANPWYFE